jgi:D-alanyl-D-alanine carboxypeptidase/D-alanyl-D-alanine-endopeptidase (penicillin-binding protein 4)
VWPGRETELSQVGAALQAAMPVAARTGTLATRMQGSAAAGRCEAKTGTLTGYSTLAGYCDDRFAFALMDDGISTAAAHVVQDRITEALAGLVSG